MSFNAETVGLMTKNREYEYKFNKLYKDFSDNKYERPQIELSPGWNWGAAIISILINPFVWLVYRRMYSYAGFVLLAYVALFVFSCGYIGYFLPVAAFIFFGVYGDSLYFKHLHQKYNEAKTFSENKEHLTVILREYIPTNISGAFIIGMLSLVFAAVLFILSMMVASQTYGTSI